ncbi:MAG TPA: gliding motility-associated C-terminal domain-containing protein, partial [Bacteroidia bacterium]|nr:gliding motility-associated C-terminal domain-containing protein [Bacteroidia bacterium]
LLIAKSASGCVDSTFKKQAIHQYRNPIVDIARDSTFCMQQQLTFAVTLTADDSIVSMEWRVDSMPVSTTPDLKLMYVTPGVHTISYEAITNHGCIRDTTFELTIHPLPIPVATADTTICLGSSVQLQANDGDKYKWSPSHGLNNTGIPNPIAIPERTIQYVVQVLNQFGCMQKDTVNISVDKPVHVEVKDIPPICDGDSIQLKTVTNATKFIWTPPQSLSNDTIASPYASPTITTGYKVIAYSLNVCPNDSARTTVNVGEIPELKMVSDTSVVGGSTIQVVAQVSNVPVSYSWAPPTGLSCTDCPDPIIRNIKEDETFILTVTSAIGCIAIDTIRIKTFCGENLWIPNAFTPNNNGVNEVFYPQAPGYGIVRSMTIYDRWGQVVFTQEEFPLNDPSYGWDGRQKDGRIVGPDVYTYVIHFVCVNGDRFETIGKVTLLK